MSVKELDAQKLTPAAVREIEENYACRCLFGVGGKAFIVNEAHGLRKDTIKELLTAIEPPGGLPEHIMWAFTTTKQGEQHLFECDESGDAAPLLSRCIEVQLVYDDATRLAFAKRAQEIARSEGIDGLPLSVYTRAVAASRGNFRRVLQQIESGGFRADAVASLRQELDLLQSTKGQQAERRRAELKAAIAAAESPDTVRGQLFGI
jgi:hypothetical protein